MRNEPALAIRLEGENRRYLPGESLAGEYLFEALSAIQIKAVEVSVLWYSEGKGEEDMDVHAFWRWDAEHGNIIDPQRPMHLKPSCPIVRFPTTARS